MTDIKNDKANGYNLLYINTFTDGFGFALGVDLDAEYPFSIWQFSEQDDKRIFYNGIFYPIDKYEEAYSEFHLRIKKYRTDNPNTGDGYAYLASTELTRLAKLSKESEDNIPIKSRWFKK